MSGNPDRDKWIDAFIRSQVAGKGLDERTSKAYRLDLEHLHAWLALGHFPGRENWEGSVERYLEYLSLEKHRRPSTIYRKQRVFSYYLSYLAAEGVIERAGPLKSRYEGKERKGRARERILGKREIDAFFEAIGREYTELESGFRKRVCLRDQVMMGLLFYHGMEISELLRLEVKDYDRKSGRLTVKRKHGEEEMVQLFSGRLRGQLERWLDEHGYFERGEGYDERMFLSKLGKPLSMKMVTNIFEKYRVLAGVEKEVTPKDLKHSLGRYAKEALEEQCGWEVLPSIMV